MSRCKNPRGQFTRPGSRACIGVVIVALMALSKMPMAEWQWRSQLESFRADEQVSIETSSGTQLMLRNPSGGSTAINRSSLSQPPTVITRSSSAATQVGLILWLDATATNTITLTNGNRVAGWSSRYGWATSATTAGLANSPTLVSNALLSRPVLRFDGSQSYLQVPIPDSANFSIFVVGRFRTNPDAAAAAIGRGGSASSGSHWSVSSRLGLIGLQVGRAGNGGYAPSSSAGATSPWVAVITHDNGLGVGFASVNGTTVAGTTGLRSALDPGSLVIGANPDFTSFAPVDLGEVRLYSRKLTTDETANVVSDLRAKWSI